MSKQARCTVFKQATLGVVIASAALLSIAPDRAHGFRANSGVGGLVVGRPFINAAGQVCTRITNSGAVPVTVDLEYVRAPIGALAFGVAGAPFIESQCNPIGFANGVTIAPGATTVPLCFNPTNFGKFCNGFVVRMPTGDCTGNEIVCISFSCLRIPKPMSAALSDRGTGIVNTFTVTVGSSAPVGATLINVNVVTISEPAGYSINVPSSITIPTPGTTSTFDIEITFPLGPVPFEAQYELEFTYDTETSLFAEYLVIAEGSTGIPGITGIPTVSQWGLIILSLLLLTGGTLVVRRMNGVTAPAAAA